MGVADSLILKLAENGLAFLMAALIIVGLCMLIKYIYAHLTKEVEHWRTKAELCTESRLNEMVRIEVENEKLKEKVSTLESLLINKKDGK